MDAAISQIYEVDDLGRTPARVNRKTGDLFINRRMWDKLPYETRMFILLHENGHAAKDTKNEIAADASAFQKYAELGLPLSGSVKALSRVLKFDNPQHYDRLNEQVRRAFFYDHLINNNNKINFTEMENLLQEYADYANEPYSDFLPPKAMKKLLSKLKPKDKSSRPSAHQVAQVQKEAADSSARKEDQAGQGEEAPKKSKSKLFLIIGAVLVVLAIAYFVFFKKKKK